RATLILTNPVLRSLPQSLDSICFWEMAAALQTAALLSASHNLIDPQRFRVGLLARSLPGPTLCTLFPDLSRQRLMRLQVPPHPNLGKLL
ncbi:hypothetical protein BHE74_00026552, partial [Ensete ventricosum]